MKLTENKVEIISDYKYKTTKGFNDQNYSMVRDSNDTPYYLINEKGEKVNNNTYKSVNALNDGKWIVTLENGSNQVLNPDGSILVNTFKVSK